ncbi:tyrosine-type recombinase/integrase [Metaclostridioides mangenotii]|uniref:tyrosine-type recombinase/integrase n=1 Tax=Metaclostridioides mangenotii TaxID=1540 RepID=UPI0026ECCD4D|nr:tyrosine-type recombinase/integrase [Clostridioides mangenotii]
MGSVFIRKRSKNYIVYLEYKDSDTSKRKQKNMGSFEKKKEATKRMIELKNSLLNDEPVVNDMSINELMLKYLSERQENLSPSSYNYYIRIFEKYIEPLIGNFKIHELKSQDIIDYIDKLRSSLSVKTLNIHLNILRLSLDFAVDCGLLNRNVAKFIKIDNIESNYKLKREFNKKDIKDILEHSKDTILEIPLYLASGVGLKLSEILGLTWNNIDFNNSTLRVDKVSVRENSSVILKEPRSKSIVRTISVPKEIMKKLKLLKEVSSKKNIKNSLGIKQNLLFYDDKANPIAEDVISRKLKQFIKENDLSETTFQELRHFHVYVLIEAGVSGSVISSRIGHSSVSTTLNMYSDIFEKFEDDIGLKISRSIFDM